MLNRRRRDVSCIRYGKQVNDYQCLYEPKPAATVSCSDECRKPYWKNFSWQPVREFSLKRLIDLFVLVYSDMFIR